MNIEITEKFLIIFFPVPRFLTFPHPRLLIFTHSRTFPIPIVHPHLHPRPRYSPNNDSVAVRFFDYSNTERKQLNDLYAITNEHPDLIRTVFGVASVFVG
jgi:hypothetical protein